MSPAAEAESAISVVFEERERSEGGVSGPDWSNLGMERKSGIWSAAFSAFPLAGMERDR